MGDMKSGVGINLFLPRLLRDLDITLGGDLIIQSVIEEECTGNGALAASLAWNGKLLSSEAEPAPECAESCASLDPEDFALIVKA